MNKRQAKKDRKKIIYGLVDEWNLLTMDEEELKEAQKEYEDYHRKYRHYKHYRDREKIAMRPCLYHYPVGRKYAEWVQRFFETTTTHHQHVTQHVILQSISDLKDRYGELPDILHEKLEQKQLPAMKENL